jgi:SOS response regulatory protein OraA/RecX
MEKTYEKAKQYLLKLLSARDYTYYELERKLRQKKYEPGVVVKAMEYIKNSGYVNQGSHALKVIDHETGSNPKGVYIIRKKLLSKGFKKEDFEEKLIGIDQEALARVQADKRMRKPFKNKDKFFVRQALSKYLATKGFPYDIIENIVNEKIGLSDNENME